MTSTPQLIRIADTLTKTQRKHKVRRSEYQATGLLPVVDQGESFVGGYVDDLNLAYPGDLPVVVFGDHTCTVKYVDFVFAIGADGTQILKPTQDWDVKYFYYCMKSLDLSHFGYQRHFKFLKEETIPLRPIDDQKKIAALLAAFDEPITNNTRRIEILEEMAQALYRRWFLDFQFPGHEEVAQTDSELGAIPATWEVARVKDLVQRLVARRTYSAAELASSGSTVVIDQSRRDAPGFHDDEAAHFASPSDPIIVFGDHTCRMQLMTEPFSLGPNVIPFRPKIDRPVTYMFHLVAGLVQQREYKRHWSELMANKVAVATKETADTFAMQVMPLHAMIGNLRAQNLVLRSLRDLLLPKLISGQVDISNLDVDTSWLAA